MGAAWNCGGVYAMAPASFGRSALSKITSVKKAWLAALAALILCASIYPVLGTRDRLRDRFEGNVTPLTLNGAAFIESPNTENITAI